MAGLEWEMSKENVAPLRHGRNVTVLNKALKTPKHELEAQLAALEGEVRVAVAGSGPHKDDPLEPWTRYTKWIVENFPQGSDKLVRAIEEVCRMYAKTERYRDDIRFVRLWIRYIDLRSDKLDVFKYMNRKRIGESWSLFYEAWAITLEIARQYDDAEKVYTAGREKQAKPVERLAQREREYYNRMAARRRRDEKKKREIEEKRVIEVRHSEARRDRESRRLGSSLANNILLGPESDHISPLQEPSMGRVRPALGQITEEQARSGRRPFVLERKSSQPSASTTQISSRISNEVRSVKAPKFEVHSGVTGPPISASSKHEEDGDCFIPLLARRDEIQKEDAGQLPTKWAGETLPQNKSLSRKLKRRTIPFEVYEDPATESPQGDLAVDAAIRGIQTGQGADILDFDNTLQATDMPKQLSPQSYRKTSSLGHASQLLDGSSSPTISTKLAMKEVDDAFNLCGEQRNLQGEAGLAEEEEQDSKYFLPSNEKPNSSYHRNVHGQGAKENCVGKNSIPACVETSLQSSQGLSGNFQQFDLTEFLASWCNNDADFRLLEDPDPEIEADEIFELQCRRGIVTFNVDKYQWGGHRQQSFVVLADDLNNCFGLLDASTENGSDDDDFKVLAVKVSQTSNAWEYYIYKTIHARLSHPPSSIPRALGFCEGNPNSYLILDSCSTCSLHNALQLFPEKKFSESLSMFFTVNILKTVEVLHGVNVIHSDVTLDNILFRSDVSTDISSHSYASDGANGWSEWGVYLIDYNHAIDVNHPQLRGSSVLSLAQFVGNSRCSFLHESYRSPGDDIWAFSADCYLASTCAAKMLGLKPDCQTDVESLQHSPTWKNFFAQMQTLDASSSASDTCAAIRTCRMEMERILAADKLLAISIMTLTNIIVDADNADMTTGF